MSIFLQYLLSGIGSGAIYALIALGFCLVYKGTRAINFAQGEYVVVAGVLASVLRLHEHWPLWLAAVSAVAAGVVMGLATELVAVRFLRRPNPLTVTIGTVGVGIAIDAILILRTNGATYVLPPFSAGAPIHLGGALISPQTIWNVGIAALVVLALGWFFNRTRRGISLRAAADDADTASAYGVSLGSTTLWTFGLGGALAALAGVAITPVTLMASTQGTEIGLVGFAAAMLGGLTSLPGAMLGGLLLGVAQSLFGGYVSGTYSDLFAFATLLIVLFVRPRGILGSAVVQRV